MLFSASEDGSIVAWDVDYSMVMNTFKEAGGPRCAAILLRSLRGVDQAVRDSI